MDITPLITSMKACATSCSRSVVDCKGYAAVLSSGLCGDGGVFLLLTINCRRCVSVVFYVVVVILLINFTIVCVVRLRTIDQLNSCEISRIIY